jgi:hypothetical protein
MTKLTQEQIKNVLGRIPYGKRQGECVKCLQTFSEDIDSQIKEFHKFGTCRDCNPNPHRLTILTNKEG